MRIHIPLASFGNPAPQPHRTTVLATAGFDIPTRGFLHCLPTMFNAEIEVRFVRNSECSCGVFLIMFFFCRQRLVNCCHKPDFFPQRIFYIAFATLFLQFVLFRLPQFSPHLPPCSLGCEVLSIFSTMAVIKIPHRSHRCTIL